MGGPHLVEGLHESCRVLPLWERKTASEAGIQGNALRALDREEWVGCAPACRQAQDETMGSLEGCAHQFQAAETWALGQDLTWNEQGSPTVGITRLKEWDDSRETLASLQALGEEELGQDTHLEGHVAR